MMSSFTTTTTNRVACLVLLVAVLSITAPSVLAQDTNGWDDGYKLDYSYDNLKDDGPSQWGAVAPINNRGWGEWETVRLASALTNEDLQPLFEWPANQCGTEARPSPIEIIPTENCADTQEMMTRRFNAPVDCRHPVEGNVRQSQGVYTATTAVDISSWEITPYSLRYYLPRTDQTCRRPTLRLPNIFGADRRNQEEHFVLMWLEVHARSEHVVDGRRYDAELQMVHIATTRPNELLVVSVLIDSSSMEDHQDFQRYLLDGWQGKALQEEAICGGGKKKRELVRERRHLRGDLRGQAGHFGALQDYLQAHNNGTAATFYDDSDTTIASTQTKRKLQGGGGGRCEPDKYGNGCQDQGIGPRRRMFPYNLWPSMWYYSYQGSLTAPPCQGQVHWRIIDTPLSISRRQYKQLTTLMTQSRDDSCRMDSAVNLEGENFRPLQNATLEQAKQGGNDNGPQLVSHCTSEDFFVTVYDEDEQ